MSIGKKIRALRKERSLSQGDIAAKIGVDRSNVSQWETESAEPRLANIKALAKLFDVDIISLIEDEENTIQPPPGSESGIMWAAIALLLDVMADLLAEKGGITHDQALISLKKRGGPILAGLDNWPIPDRGN